MPSLPAAILGAALVFGVVAAVLSRFVERRLCDDDPHGDVCVTFEGAEVCVRRVTLALGDAAPRAVEFRAEPGRVAGRALTILGIAPALRAAPWARVCLEPEWVRAGTRGGPGRPLVAAVSGGSLARGGWVHLAFHFPGDAADAVPSFAVRARGHMVRVDTPLVPAVGEAPGARNIPLRLLQTSFVEDGAVPLGVASAMDTWAAAVRPGRATLFGDAACRHMIGSNFPPRVLGAYDALVPTAFRADLWRYCALFLFGGFYADAKSSWARPEVRLSDAVPADVDVLVVADMWQTQNLFVRQDLYNAVMGFRPRHPLLARVIGRVVCAVEARDYGRNPVAITGPGALGDAFADEYGVRRAYGWRGRRVLTNSAGHTDTVLMWRLAHDARFRARDVRGPEGVPHVNVQYGAYRADQRRAARVPHYRELWRRRRVFADPPRNRPAEQTEAPWPHRK